MITGLDQYDRVARLYPVYTVLLPISLLLVALFGAEEWWKLALGLVAGASVPYFLTDMVRKYGKRCETAMFANWDGPPTTDLLRHHPTRAMAHTNPGLRAARWTAVAALSGKELPTAEEERTDKVAADQRYDVAVNIVRKKLAGDERVQREVRHYGMWRNLYALRDLMLLCGLLAAAADVALLVIGLSHHTWISSHLLIADLVLAVAAIVASRLVFTEAAVRGVANEYADTLLQAATATPAVNQ